MAKSKNTFEFLYCFDDNFIKQALTSIISLLENVVEPISINIIHPNKNISEYIPLKIKDHKNLKMIRYKTFNNYEYAFPNIEDAHISEATYYRIFMDNYLNKNISNIVYIDADIICIGDPTNIILETIEELHENNLLLSAKTESDIRSAKDNTFERLPLNSKYFNAGLMIINYQKWQKENVQKDLIRILIEHSSKIVFWDQDILNIHINGKYHELSEKLNTYAHTIEKNIKSSKSLLIHYVGSKKPWLTSGAFEIASEIYHSNYRQIFTHSYHIEHKWKSASVKELLFAIAKLKILKLDNIFRYIKDFILSLKK